MALRIELTAGARKQLRKLDRQVAIRIVRFLEHRVAPSDNPRSLGTALVGEPLWRYRVGDYRIVCEIDDGLLRVLVVSIGHRGDVYR